MSVTPSRWWVVVNPHARGPLRNAALVGTVRAAVGGRGIVSATDNLDALDAAAVQARRTGCDAVAVVGGDGSVSRTLTAVRRAWGSDPWPALALPGGGTMNTVARGLGLRPGAVVPTVQRLLDRPPRARRGAALVVDHDRVGFLFGIGITSRFIEAYESGGRPTRLDAVRTLARAVGSALTGGPFTRWLAEPHDAVLEIDGAPAASGGWRIVMAGASPDVGLGFRPFPPAPLGDPDDTFGVFGTRSTMPELAADLVRIRAARPVPRPSAFAARAHTLVLRFAPGTAPVLQLDGDLWVGGDRVEITLGPPLTYLAPG